ncbi:hypothetical protein BROUX41_004383 [Berkeleyomyces rouxiae]|uniref:uncharacterized protein n=1 Tax=Berkeleyomyces rouxiae TaxID=2035830 RepID=UPI003B7B39AB
MTSLKRRRSSVSETEPTVESRPHAVKRFRRGSPFGRKSETGPKGRSASALGQHDHLTNLSDEMLLRILSFSALNEVLTVSLVCQRLYSIACDPQIWRSFFYGRFIEPRARRVSSHRNNPTGLSGARLTKATWQLGEALSDKQDADGVTDWKTQYKVHYNWAKGECQYEEVVTAESAPSRTSPSPQQAKNGLVGMASVEHGLRIFCMKRRLYIAHTPLDALPLSLTLDFKLSSSQPLVAVGFEAGTLAIWRLAQDPEPKLVLIAKQDGSRKSGDVIKIASSFPYLIASTSACELQLFDTGRIFDSTPRANTKIPEPILISKFHGHYNKTSTFFIRHQSVTSAVASVAFSSSSIRGWCVGLQEFHIKRQGGQFGKAEIHDTRSVVKLPQIYPCQSLSQTTTQTTLRQSPRALSYSHPYLVMSLLDNTLMLFVCQSTEASLMISEGFQLVGCTSAVAGVGITSRGKAISISKSSDEIRVWDLEALGSRMASQMNSATRPPRRPSPLKANGLFGNTSYLEYQGVIGLIRNLLVRPRPERKKIASFAVKEEDSNGCVDMFEWASERFWVGFDDEYVTVSKINRDGTEILTLYDFT